MPDQADAGFLGYGSSESCKGLCCVDDRPRKIVQVSAIPLLGCTWQLATPVEIRGKVSNR